MDNRLRCRTSEDWAHLAAFDPTSPLARRRRLPPDLPWSTARTGLLASCSGVHVIESEVEVDDHRPAPPPAHRARCSDRAAYGLLSCRTAGPASWHHRPALRAGHSRRGWSGGAVDARASRSADGIRPGQDPPHRPADRSTWPRTATSIDSRRGGRTFTRCAGTGSITRRLREAAATPGQHRLLARRAVRARATRVMSRPESHLRMLLLVLAFAQPSVDVQFSDPDGRLGASPRSGLSGTIEWRSVRRPPARRRPRAVAPTSIGGRTSTTATGAW